MHSSRMVRSFSRGAAICAAVAGAALWLHRAADVASAQSPALQNSVVTASSEQPRERRVRLFWQDREHDALKWSDLYSGAEWSLEPAPAPVTGFPTLDVARQDLVQMEILDGVLLAGVRDDADGAFQSGWVAVDTGVREHSHGDHSDWTYAAPSVRATRLDDEQGNPAHLYLYDGGLYLANDARDGFTKFVAEDLKAAPPQGRFFSGGGNHITLAALQGLIAYSAWIDGEGPNMGRVDVVDLQAEEDAAPAYSIYLPTGGIHGAIANSNRVFFAPQDGICWVEPDYSLSKSKDSVQIHYISLGKDEESEKPLRTGAFVNHRNWVLFSCGRGDSSALCLLDAAAAQPAVVKLPIDVADGLSLVTPRTVRTAAGRRLAFLFQDRPEGEGAEFLTIVDLDPNGDRNLSDARIAQTLEVGASKVEGHHGHHAIDFDASGGIACFTNPGDGTLSILSLETLSIEATLPVGGVPSAICAMGGREHAH